MSLLFLTSMKNVPRSGPRRSRSLVEAFSGVTTDRVASLRWEFSRAAPHFIPSQPVCWDVAVAVVCSHVTKVQKTLMKRKSIRGSRSVLKRSHETLTNS